jgi:hypothetical protein
MSLQRIEIELADLWDRVFFLGYKLDLTVSFRPNRKFFCVFVMSLAGLSVQAGIVPVSS